VLVQLPLPQHIKEEAIIDSFDPQKDVDGFHPLNMGAACAWVAWLCSLLCLHAARHRCHLYCGAGLS
jgi:hypothetical protein